MSTRGAICFVIDGQEKVVYNQADSYPDGLGEDIAAWLRAAVSSEAETADAVRRLAAVSGEPTDEDRVRLAAFRDPRVNQGEGWYSLLRQTQGDPAAILAAGVYESAEGFPLDSLFCEWAYVVDFDDRRLEVYEGYQRTPITRGRWADRSACRDGYYPVQAVASWPFDELPAARELARRVDLMQADG